MAASVAGFLQESDFKILLIYGISHTNPKLVYQITTCTGSPPSYLLNGLAAIGVDLYTPQALFKMLPPDDSSFASFGLSRRDGNYSQYHLAVGTEPSVDEPWP